MRKHKITIEFESDAPQMLLEVIACDMKAQLESLEDGTYEEFGGSYTYHNDKYSMDKE